MIFSSEVLGVRREYFKVLFKDPSRRNLFHQIREVNKIETTWRNRDLGFLLPLAVTMAIEHCW